LIWVAEVFVAYVAIGLWLVTLRDVIRRGAGAAGIGAMLLSAALLAWPWLAHVDAVPVLLASSCAAAVILLLGRKLAHAQTPAQIKERREDQRQAYLHLVLLTGAIIFMVPFLWLVSTSFKVDADILTNEIRFMPRRPVKIDDGKGEKLALVTVAGSALSADQQTIVPPDDPNSPRTGVWALVKDLEDTILVAPVYAGGRLGKESKVSPDAVKPILKPGFVWENYPESLNYLPEETRYGLVYLNNTLKITIFSIIGTLLTASMVAFSFARLRWPGRDGLFVLLLATMMLPGAVTMIPQFLIWQRLGYIDTLVPLWAGAFLGGGAFNVFLLRQFFLTIPSELEEAAKIDGCSYWRTYWTIMLPLVRPALATVAIMTFMGSWNNFMGPLIYISSPTKMPIAYALQLYQSVHGGEYGYMMAASTLVMLPVLMVFFFCQRYFIQGITLTGLKG
jgi:multiple sugar transport system permease protein